MCGVQHAVHEQCISFAVEDVSYCYNVRVVRPQCCLLDGQRSLKQWPAHGIMALRGSSSRAADTGESR
jgi:hypothetical protein